MCAYAGTQLFKGYILSSFLQRQFQVVKTAMIFSTKPCFNYWPYQEDRRVQIWEAWRPHLFGPKHGDIQVIETAAQTMTDLVPWYDTLFFYRTEFQQHFSLLPYYLCNYEPSQKWKCSHLKNISPSVQAFISLRSTLLELFFCFTAADWVSLFRIVKEDIVRSSWAIIRLWLWDSFLWTLLFD